MWRRDRWPPGRHPCTLDQPISCLRFAQGFLAMLPLWTGAIPVGIAYGAAARDVGLSLVETHLMSLTVFSAAAQMSAVALIGAGMPAVILIGTALALNIQLLLIGLSVGRQTHPGLTLVHRVPGVLHPPNVPPALMMSIGPIQADHYATPAAMQRSQDLAVARQQ